MADSTGLAPVKRGQAESICCHSNHSAPGAEAQLSDQQLFTEVEKKQANREGQKKWENGKK